jgi:hypothetical protein
VLSIIVDALEDGSTMDGECSPSPLSMSVPDAAVVQMENALHCLCPC